MLSVICGTNRPDSNSEKVARNYCSILQEKGVGSVILKLEDLPNDFAFNAMFGKRLQAVDEAIDKHIRPFDKLVFILPEYHGSYPGVLKTFLDCMGQSDLEGKKAALVGLSDGMAGNLRGLDDLTNVLNFLKVDVLSRKPKLSRVSSSLNEGGAITDERCLRLLNEQIDYFLEF